MEQATEAEKRLAELRNIKKFETVDCCETANRYMELGWETVAIWTKFYHSNNEVNYIRLAWFGPDDPKFPESSQELPDDQQPF